MLFINSKNKKIKDKFFNDSDKIYVDYWHSGNLFYCKSYTRGVIKTHSNIYN